ncbi:MAG TPA: HNH endonuclease [Thermoanaerobaculia bacterium]|nr:HNH endonuclease [Thermoanaerobaculia bacterium]
MTWKAIIGNKEYPAADPQMLRTWFAEKRLQPDTHVFHSTEAKWMCLRDVPELTDLFSPNQTLIDKYREDFGRALLAMDHEVATLIGQGKEMRALMLLSENFQTILGIHESLHLYYGMILRHVDVLKRFGSERLKQLGHDPIFTRESLQDADISADELEQFVGHNLEKAGYRRTHWLIKDVVLREVDYMLDALQILVEPEFVPLETSVETDDNVPDRYVPPAVKIAVWRRDEGKCVQCKSREKLEYDHIIPVAKGGSNTERNIQLLCEPCNRTKATRIQ